MIRRFILQFGAAGLTLSALVAVSGCGFQLRGAQTFAFDSVAVTAAQEGPVAAELRRALGSKLFVPSPVVPGAAVAVPEVIVDVVSEQREKSVVGFNSAGQVREFQLRLRVKFRLRTPQGRELIADSEIYQQRTISFNESAVLAKEVEENLLYRDMQSDIVGQLSRQLSAVKSVK